MLFSLERAQSLRRPAWSSGRQQMATAFGMNVRVQAAGGESPVLRLLWLKEYGKWRIAAYDVEAP